MLDMKNWLCYHGDAITLTGENFRIAFSTADGEMTELLYIKIKKLLALVMAMTMVLGMAITVSAAPGDTANATVVVSDVDTFY